MNKRAERFKKFIADQKVEGFTIEEPKSEPNNLVLFRSNFRMDGNLLPFGIFVDDTPFAMIRVVVVAEALRDDNEKEVTGLINQLNLNRISSILTVPRILWLNPASSSVMGKMTWGICSFLC